MRITRSGRFWEVFSKVLKLIIFSGNLPSRFFSEKHGVAQEVCQKKEEEKGETAGKEEGLSVTVF